MVHFLKFRSWLVIITFFITADKSYAQTLSTPDQKANALVVDSDIINNSENRRSEGETEYPREDDYPWEQNEFEEYHLRSFGHMLEGNSSTFYLSRRLQEGDWWCVTGVTEDESGYVYVSEVVEFFDDMITINVESGDPVVIMLFDQNDYLLMAETFIVDTGSSSLSPGIILSGDQTILDPDSARKVYATFASGGDCNHEYEYEWEFAGIDGVNGGDFVDNLEEIGLNLEDPSLINQSSLPASVIREIIHYLIDHNYWTGIIKIRRKVTCGSESDYAGDVTIGIVEPHTSGTLTADQTIFYGQIPATIHGTTPYGGICNGEYQYLWQYSHNNYNYFNLLDQTSDSLVFNGILHDTTWYRRVVYCGYDIAISNSVKISVNPPLLVLKPGVNTYFAANIVTARKLPAVYADTPIHYLRTYVPNIPLQDTGDINMSADVQDVGVVTIYNDSYGRTIQAVSKQTSPLKKDNVVVSDFDQFGRTPYSYLPYTSTSENGNFKVNAFYQDSTFYKGLFPNEKIIYNKTVFDGSPFNIPKNSYAPGNSWGGSNRGTANHFRTNKTSDSVRFWTIPISNEDDLPVNNRFYVAGSLSVQELLDEENMTAVKYTDELGRTVMSKSLFQSSITSGESVWLYTYYVYDEMNRLRMVIPPKATDALKTSFGASNWNLATDSTINLNLCYAYYYDEFGRVTMKRIPGKGKSYTAYDLLGRVVMTQDPNLRQTDHWAFVLYDGQCRPIKSGVITSSLSKDSVIVQASRSNNYPALSGTYLITSETYYDDYGWIAATSAPVSDSINRSHINSANFNTSYNASPDYAQALTKSLRIRGAITGTKKLILNTNDYLYNVSFYDERGRSIQTQQNNYSGGTDIATIQYSYNGRILRSHLTHQKSGTNPQVHTVLTKYSYDHIGRLLTVTNNFDSLGDKTVKENSYNELGQLSNTVIGDNLETQEFTYNIRGWVLGINGDYVKNSSSTSNYFGEILAYDSGFVNTQYNGNIAGISWKAGGDGIGRAYGYSYDKVNRLTKAEFYQQNEGGSNWTNDKVDYSVSNLTYDANGNILSMKQRGLLVGSSVTIDSLSYHYFSNSNLLKKVSDGIPDVSPLGDFKDTTATGDDYAYDINGNIVSDNNRRLHTASGTAGAKFNMLDKPDSMIIAGKSGTYYYYDAGGNTVRKQINDYTSGSLVTKNYLYINGFVYLNDTLQYALTNEGRIRYAQKRNSTDASIYYAYEYDYFIRDHQGNVRALLTEGKDTAIYHAGMETTDSTYEDALFANEYSPLRTVYDKPSGFDSDAGNNRVCRLNASTGTNLKTGPSLVLKVMAGDKVQMSTYGFYNTAVQSPQSGVNLLTDILAVLPGAVANNSGGKVAAGNLSALSTALSPNITEFLNEDRPYNNTRPKAYLNWILFDEQFNFVASNSGVKQVEAGSEKQPLVAPLQTMTKNGFLYVYVSNESPMNVYFDDITIQHFTGPLLQEQSFYPFGLQMAGISSKAVLKRLGSFKYNGGSELEDEGELNYYNTFYRKYDAQIGRFTGLDMLSDSYAGITPYQFGANNPVMFNDPTGAFLNYVDPDQSNTISQLPGFFSGLYSRGMQDFNDWLGLAMFEAGQGTGSWNSGGGGGGGGGGTFNVTDDGVGFTGSLAGVVLSALSEALNVSMGSEFNFDMQFWKVNDPSSGNFVGIVFCINNDALNPNEGDYMEERVGGIKCVLGFVPADGSEVLKYKWIQTVITNNPKDGGTPTTESVLDQSPEAKAENQGYSQSSGQIKEMLKQSDFQDKNYSSAFKDAPWRYIWDGYNGTFKTTSWEGRLSMVDTRNKNAIMIQFTYGFNITRGVVTPTPLQVVSNPTHY